MFQNVSISMNLYLHTYLATIHNIVLSSFYNFYIHIQVYSWVYQIINATDCLGKHRFHKQKGQNYLYIYIFFFFYKFITNIGSQWLFLFYTYFLVSI